jgi:hypothetical protein
MLALCHLWHKFIPALLATGLKPHQLKWPGLCVTSSDLDSGSTYSSSRCSSDDDYDNDDEAATAEEETEGEDEQESGNDYEEPLFNNDLFSKVVEHSAFLYKGIILPALRSHGCLSMESPFADILKQANSLEHFYDFEIEGMRRALSWRLEFLNDEIAAEEWKKLGWPAGLEMC